MKLKVMESIKRMMKNAEELLDHATANTRAILITVGVKDQVWLVMFKKLVKLLIKVF